MTHFDRQSRVVAIALCGGALAAACSRGHSSPGIIDTTSGPPASYTPAAAPGVQVTSTDGKSVERSAHFELTADNFAHFMAAADSVVALEGRDPTARAYLSNDLKDAPAKIQDAGRNWLEANPIVNNAIARAGISVEDYFVAAIAVASAERFMSDPKAAPPTPTLSKNAEFLRGHRAELAHLAALQTGAPLSTTTAPSATPPKP